MKYRIIRNWDDHPPVVLGHVSTSKIVDFDELWDEFQNTNPDSDTEFVKWLCTEHGMTWIDDEFEDITVGT